MYTHQLKYITSGIAPKQSKGAIVMLHGRGSSAQNIIGLADSFNVSEYCIYAPQAVENSWYPYSFVAPEKDNEPALSSALSIIEQLVQEISNHGIEASKIYFIGFSQGACLTLEYITRHAQAYGGAVAFTGGLVGEELNLSKYNGDFHHTPVFISTGDPDFHVPLERVEESVKVLRSMNADVTLKVYKGRPHTISRDEIEQANQLLFEK